MAVLDVKTKALESSFQEKMDAMVEDLVDKKMNEVVEKKVNEQLSAVVGQRVNERVSEVMDERLKTWNEEHNGMKADLEQRLAQQVAKNQALESRLQALDTTVEQLTTRLSGEASSAQDKQETHSRATQKLAGQVATQDLRLKELETARERYVTVQDQRLSTLPNTQKDLENQQVKITALFERMESVERDIRSLDREPQGQQELPPEPPELKPPSVGMHNNTSTSQLDMKVETLRSMLVDTLGDVKSLERQLKTQDSSIDYLSARLRGLQEKSPHYEQSGDVQRHKSQSATPSMAEDGHYQQGDGQLQRSFENNHEVAGSLEAKMRSMIVEMLQQHAAETNEKCSRLARGLGKLVDTEREKRAKSVDSLTKTFDDKLEASLKELSGKSTSEASTAPDTAAKLDAQQKSIDSLHSNLKGTQQTLSTKSQNDYHVLEEFKMQIAYLSQWQNNFNSDKIATSLIAHIAHALPQGTHIQLGNLRERVRAVEEQVGLSENEAFKRRKVANGSAVSVNGH